MFSWKLGGIPFFLFSFFLLWECSFNLTYLSNCFSWAALRVSTMIRGLLMLSRGPACQFRANYVRLSYHPMAALSTTSSFKQEEQDQFGTIRKRRPPRKRESKRKAPQRELQVPTTNTGVMDYGHFQSQPRVTTGGEGTEADTFGTLDPQLTQQLIASTG